MEDRVGLFQAALGIAAPWQVTKAEFDAERGRLDIFLDFPRGARFACPEGDEDACAVHDTEDKTWRHLDFFQHQAHLHARVPRVGCPAHGVRRVALPWARPGSGFTLLFEALLLEFAPHMPVAAIARMVGEHDTRVWRVLEHYVARARAGLDFSDVTRVGADETSARRGQDYVSVFMDLAAPRVMFATEGRDAATVARFGEDLTAHGRSPKPPALRSPPWDHPRMPITVHALPVALADDAERTWDDDEGGAPLRCCLRDSRPGERVALVSVAPPGPRGAYAETGPVFMHADRCAGPGSLEYPRDWLQRRQVLRAYDEGGAIIGGELVEAGEDHVAAAERLLADPAVAFLHTRNVVHGCYMLSIRRS